jgi:prepilin-type N-terminal cleavage/methylation domain-containing protein
VTGRGFTLIELVMVTAIVSVIAAVAIPRYGSSVANMRVQMAARKLAADVKMVQSQARAISATRKLEFVPASNRYRVPLMAGLDGAPNYEVDLAAAPYRASFTLTFDGVGTLNTVNFDGYGAPNRGVAVQITAGGVSRTVHVNKVSGATSITTP